MSSAGSRVDQSPNNDNAPIPLAQMEAIFYDETMNHNVNTAKEKPEMIEDDNSAPAVQYEVYDEVNVAAKKKPEVIEDNDDPPLPPSQISALYAEGNLKGVTRTTANNLVCPESRHTNIICSSNNMHQHISSVPELAVAHSLPAINRVERDRTLPSMDQEQVVVDIRPIPPPILEDSDLEPNETSLPIVNASVVEDEPARPIYNAVEVENCTWWTRHQKYIFVAIASLVIGAMTATIVMLVGTREDRNNVPHSTPKSKAPSEPSSSQIYYADNENQRCHNEHEVQLYVNLRKRGFGSIEECCESEFQYSEKNRCIINSLRITAPPASLPSNNKSDTGLTLEPVDPNVTEPTTFSTDYSPSADATTHFTSPAEDFYVTEPTSYSTPTLPVEYGPSAGFTPPYTSPTYALPASVIWKQQGQSISGEGAGDQVGYTVALSSDSKTLAVGARYNDGNGDDSGHVRVYHLEDSGLSWSQLGPDIDGETPGDLAGFSVALSANGTVLAVGAVHNDGINGENSGHTRIYRQEEVGTSLSWKQLGDDIDGEGINDLSGYSVALSGDGRTLAVGAPWADESGHTRIYRMEGSIPIWRQLGTKIRGESAKDHSGYAVDLSYTGNTVANGARYNDGKGYESGHVMIYRWGTNWPNWKKVGQDIDGESPGDGAGFSVALSSAGNTVAIGSVRNSNNGEHSGHVRVYSLYDNDAGSSWLQLGQTIVGEEAGDQCGVAVDLSSDGKTLAVGANGNDGSYNAAGHVRVYRLDDNETSPSWVQIGGDIDGETLGDNFGHAVSLSGTGTTVAIGAIYHVYTKDQAGQVKVFTVDD